MGAIALLIAALGAGIAIGRATETTTEPVEPATPAEPAAVGLASAEVVAAVDANIEAWNAIDQDAVATAYADDAVFSTLDANGPGETVERALQIARFAGQASLADPWGIERIGDVLASGDVVSYGITYRGVSGTTNAVTVLVFDDEMRISRQWVIG